MKRFALRLVLTVLLSLGIPFLFWAGGYAVFVLSVYTMKEPSVLLRTDGAIVLTGGTNRVEKGLYLLRGGQVQNLLISGAHKDVRMADLKLYWTGDPGEFPESRITIGHRAENTIENAQEAGEWISRKKLGSVRLITGTYHMPRALLEFRHLLPGVSFLPHAVQPERFRPEDKRFWTVNFIEYNKLIIAIFRVVLFPGETTPLPRIFHS